MIRSDKTALNIAVDRLREENGEVALVACHLLDRFIRDSSPDHLEPLKDVIRSGIQDAEDHIRRYKARKARRKRLIAPRIKRKGALGRQLKGHLGVIEQRTALYRERTSILRQVGDAVVWHLLQYDIRRVAPLYKPGPHQLPSGIGLAGVIQLQRTLHASGQFLAMETDLTRCAGLGDLLVVRRDGRQLAPLNLEVKTKNPTELREDVEVEMAILTAGSGHPLDQEALRMLTDLTGKDLEDELVISERGERQAAEIASRTSIIAEALTSGAKSLRAPDRNWTALKRVVDRALQSGCSLDIAEKGVYYFAFEVRESSSNEAALRSLRRDVRKFAAGELGAALSIQLHDRGDLSGLVPPIPLWKLPLSIRARILSGQIVVGTFVEQDVLQQLLRSAGLDMTEQGGIWTVRDESGQEVSLGPLHAQAARLGIVVGALSPRSIADGIIEAFRTSTPAEH